MERLFEKGQHTDAHWVITYSHETQSSMKNASQQRCLDKALKMRGLNNRIHDKVWLRKEYQVYTR